MKKVLVFRHAPSEGPGYLVEWLERRGVSHELIAVDEGAPLLRDPRESGALVFMGGPMSVNDRSFRDGRRDEAEAVHSKGLSG